MANGDRILFLSFVLVQGATCWYQPQPGARFQWQLQVDEDTPFDYSMDADIYDIDLWAVTEDDINAIHQ